MYFCYFMCWRNILFYMREYSDAIKLPKSYPTPVVGGWYRISNILMAKEVNKEVKKAVAASVPNHEILWKYEICFKQKGNQKNRHNCSSRKCRIFFSAQLKCVANGISVQNVNVLPIIWSHVLNFSLHIQCNMKFVKIYSIK